MLAGEFKAQMPRRHGSGDAKRWARPHHQAWQARRQARARCAGGRRPFRLHGRKGQDCRRNRRFHHASGRLGEQVILLDTHVLLWMACEPKRLSAKAREAIRNARQGSGVAVATITVWELAWVGAGRTYPGPEQR